MNFKAFGLLSVIITLGILAYLIVPLVRYFLIPLTGGTRAPHFGIKASGAMSIKPGLLGNQKELVSTIDQVPAEGGWINSSPLNSKLLRSQNKVILVDFWTYSCINCIRATPYTQELWNRYKDHGLIVIGIHTPEFEFERDPKNILSAIQRAGITYPVQTDAYKELWNLFGNHFWPGKYLINPQGYIVYTQFGEGNYEHEEHVVRKHLEKAGWKLPPSQPISRFLEPVNKETTPELYAGVRFLRKAYGNQEQPERDAIVSFTIPPLLEPDTLYLQGQWRGTADYAQSESDGRIEVNYLANAPYIVLAPQGAPVEVEVLLDKQPIPKAYQGQDIQERNGKTLMLINEPRLYYPLAHTTDYGRRTITFKVPPGLRFYSFTFGSY
jgi:thiol-disulfide isomerase/thioredoxin